MRKFMHNSENVRIYCSSIAAIALRPKSCKARHTEQQTVTIVLRSSCGTGTANRTVIRAIQTDNENVCVRAQFPLLSMI